MMMAHHVVTSGLLACSYACNFTLIGTFILAEQDLADILLPLAKMAKYASFNAWLTFSLSSLHLCGSRVTLYTTLCTFAASFN